MRFRASLKMSVSWVGRYYYSSSTTAVYEVRRRSSSLLVSTHLLHITFTYIRCCCCCCCLLMISYVHIYVVYNQFLLEEELQHAQHPSSTSIWHPSAKKSHTAVVVDSLSGESGRDSSGGLHLLLLLALDELLLLWNKCGTSIINCGWLWLFFGGVLGFCLLPSFVDAADLSFYLLSFLPQQHQ